MTCPDPLTTEVSHGPLCASCRDGSPPSLTYLRRARRTLRATCLSLASAATAGHIPDFPSLLARLKACVAELAELDALIARVTPPQVLVPAVATASRVCVAMAPPPGGGSVPAAAS